MCGIVGYIGNKNAARILLNGLCVLCKKSESFKYSITIYASKLLFVLFYFTAMLYCKYH